jgi:hypothetical protein
VIDDVLTDAAIADVVVTGGGFALAEQVVDELFAGMCRANTRQRSVLAPLTSTACSPSPGTTGGRSTRPCPPPAITPPMQSPAASPAWLIAART